MTNKQDVRRILNIHFCPGCKQDTMPLDTTGRCAWCDRQLCEPTRTKPAVPRTEAGGQCQECLAFLPDDQYANRRRFCSLRCQQLHWMKHTEKGQAYRRRRNRQSWERKKQRRDERRAA